MTELGTGWPIHPAADLFPLLGDAELAELAEDIRAHGLHEPVWIYQGLLLDGRNRRRACELAGVPLRVREYTGTDPIAFSISANVKRRHLTPGQLADLALDVEALYAAENKVGRPKKETQEIVADRPQFNPEERKSRERAARAVGAKGRNVSKAKRLRDKAPDLAKQVKAGTLAIDRADRIQRDREAEQRRIEQARAEAAVEPLPTRVDIRHGDFRQVLADLTNVDAVITDPPYPREFLPLLADLAAWADKALTPDGVMAVLLGQSHLDEAYRLLSGHRHYRWTACYFTPGAGYAAMNARVQSHWKPLIVYGGGPRFDDVIRCEGTGADARSNHKWGQDYNAFHTIIERLTSKGQTIADPFMGSGTTLLAGYALGRHVIGCDVDEASVARARERLA